ncbi:tetratricopeptide repeat protein [Dyella sp. BiH032]|uniref:tetratricopeptide repeat protein n=1 Tax=Dyella sp. BiH032 TaxID=3075430 RepID=UPI0028933BE1|nr:tetratricopeptide repeat protein [Dyella sp. BiH032]WNL48125.1 tetratricopeptide repeat protein [Dyella sp. BiH032]
MPVVVLLSLALQVGCAVHVVRSGRPLYWIWLILIGSYLAVAVYVLVAVLPDLRHDPRGRQAASKAMQVIDPQRRRRELQRRLELSDTVDNRRRLAQECLDLGDYANAQELFRSLLVGMYATEPDFMLGLAQAQAGSGAYTEARQTLEALIAANPSYRSSEGHLLYARCLEELGETDAALEEYRVLADSYPGEEGRFRYGRLLGRHQRLAEARDVFEAQLRRAKLMPGYYRRKEQAWLKAAKLELTRLGES